MASCIFQLAPFGANNIAPFGAGQGLFIMNVGERITEERKRLGHNQTKFASLAKVSLSSQKRYESGERDPDVTYLENLKQFGVDTSYVMTGVKKHVWEITYGEHLMQLGHVIASILDIAPGELELVVKNAGLLANSEPYKNIPDERISERIAIFDQFFFVNANALLMQKINTKFPANRSVNSELDRELLTLILERIENCLSEKNLKITLQKKAAVTSMLYRRFSSSDKVDTSIVDEAVELASGTDSSIAVDEKHVLSTNASAAAATITGKKAQIVQGNNMTGTTTIHLSRKKKDAV
ncbi:helix-turn-helix domain-containing protein [Collimonas humicola]|uniref:helix-turn-helix domain-containing protein n=1 Tax=Collimonas humicola TaxID=2825886 RepID=UPI001B8BFE32|nr:helix-turn-helix transcriptional regulator [Collimonas humicola]